MPFRKPLALTAIILCCALASAKDKKTFLSADVLNAKTVLVVVDPSAGVDVSRSQSPTDLPAGGEQAPDNGGGLGGED